jgi:hypothetical protein
MSQNKKAALYSLLFTDETLALFEEQLFCFIPNPDMEFSLRESSTSRLGQGLIHRQLMPDELTGWL